MKLATTSASSASSSLRMPAQSIAIAGTGRIAKAIGTLLSRSGVRIAAMAGRGAVSQLPQCANHILIAVSDDSIPHVADELAAAGLRDSTIVHTSAAAGPEALAILRPTGNAIGVLHPLQTVPSAERGIESLPGATYAIAGDDRATAWARELVSLLGGNILAVDPRRWGLYHAAAVMACNYQVTLVDAALELMEIAGISRDQALGALAPILRTTTDNILSQGPEAALTGPIRRGDISTITTHLEALKAASPETRRLYVAAGLRTIAVAALPPAAANELANRLEHAT
jgi:predicted short-subunit dehydrogenase-like oxidoreductase (DUF2520 family)